MRTKLFVAAIAMLTAAAARAEQAEEGPSLTLSSDAPAADSPQVAESGLFAAVPETTPAPVLPAPSRVLGRPIGGAWTPEGSGIDQLDAEYEKQQAAMKAGIAACQQKMQDNIANARPRASTPGQGTPANVNACFAAIKAEGISYGPRGSGVVDMLNCGGTPASIAQAWSDACRLEIPTRNGSVDSGCYFLTVESHNALTDAFPYYFCGGMDFSVFEDCYRHPYGHTAVTCSYDPTEDLRRASFGQAFNELVPAPFTPAYDAAANGYPASQSRPAVDMHQVLRGRLAYFDRIKGGLQAQGYDPQLVYVEIMTGVVLEKCQDLDPNAAVDPSCGHFNGGGIVMDSASLESFKGKTLAQYAEAQSRLSACGDVYHPAQ